MPELPEVETLRGDAERHILGRQIQGVRLLAPDVVRLPDPAALAGQLVDRTFVGARRRAKYLLLDLDSGQVLALQLALYGELLLFQPPSEQPLGRPPAPSAGPPTEPPDPDTLLILGLADGAELRLLDRSGYMRVYLASPDELVAALRLDALGPEPLDPVFSVHVLTRLLAGRRARLKGLLLDQHEIAGLGNIYVDEALWRARLHPGRAASSLSAEEIETLHRAIQEVLSEAIANRGTTFHTYRDLLGAKGQHQDHLAVFHRQGHPCPRCGTAVERITLASRDTHLCPTCQVPDAARAESAARVRPDAARARPSGPGARAGARQLET
jgi:formamidopyrimidine-DNA glycosylase